MFDQAGWFAIDSSNRAVPGVRPGSLHAGLALIGQGRVATIVGRLRDDLRVVDVDLTGVRGYAVTDALLTWCDHRGLWCLARPSGGADGRTHVFIAPGPHEPALNELVVQLRAEHRVSSSGLDLRPSGHVRPLSAPHRHGATTRPYGAVRTALRGLKTHRQTHSTTTRAQRRASSSSGSEALQPRPRRLAPLPEQWQRYLATGVAPAHAGADQSRSTDELRATAAMLRAGHTPETAWALITQAHPQAMTRARTNHRRWVLWVWNHVVREDQQHPATTTHPPRDPHVLTAVHHARARLDELMWTLPPRRRRSLLLVGHHVLDRMARTNSLRVPVPERDLVLDTGLTDRKTIRAALRALNGTVGTLHTDSWQPTQARDTSSYEFSINPVSHQRVRQIPPPSPHTPSPPPGTWATLPPTAHALWRLLSSTLESSRLDDLTQRAGLTQNRDQHPTTSQLRTARTAMVALAAAGLATCTADGHWHHATQTSTEHNQRTSDAHRELRERIEAERAAYRRAAASTWYAERARVLKAEVARRKAWWDGLDPTTRDSRRTTWASRFDSLSVHDQEATKRDLATRRQNAGINEARRHDDWINAHTPEQYAEVSAARRHRYESLPKPLQIASAQAWQRHRDRFAITRRATALATAGHEQALLPDGVASRDAAHLQDQQSAPSRKSVSLELTDLQCSEVS